jgi:ketosteroid isomerase-like protein
MMPVITVVPRRHPMSYTAIVALSLSLPLGVASLGAPRAAQPARSPAVVASSPASADIDGDVSVPVTASVANDDIVAMGRVYHPAAVLVTKAGTKPIAAALDGWGKDIVVAKKNGVRATVEFRFSSRRDDATTAFETGIFKYTTTDRAGVSKPGYTQMEALLVKHDGKWRLVMERQLESTTEAAWNALPAAH